MNDWDKAALREVLFFAARRLLGGVDGAHGGPLRVAVGDGRLREVLLYRAGGGQDDAGPPPPPDEDLLPAAARCFASPEERDILKALSLREVKGEALRERVRMGRSRFYVLTGNLRGRGLLTDGEGGYRLAEPRLVDWVERLAAAG